MPSFKYEVVWQNVDESAQDQIVAFWQAHGAIPDEQVARQRVGQVVALARSAEGEIAGVCTAIAKKLPDVGETLYYYRTFVAQPFRNGFILGRLMRLAVQSLESYSQAHPELGVSGVYLELENPSFARRLRQAVWPRPGLEFVYIGRTARGLERRVKWFAHARIGG